MLAEFWRLLKAAFDGWWADRAMSLGASIAFFTVFSLAPMLLAAIAVGTVVGIITFVLVSTGAFVELRATSH